jgi:hypothetical protein
LENLINDQILLIVDYVKNYSFQWQKQNSVSTLV